MSQSDIDTARQVLSLEIDGLEALSRSLDGRFEAAVETILSAKGRVIATGMGKSGHVARKIAATMASTGTPASFVHPAEASHGDLGMVSADDVVLALSNSGEARELSDVIAYTRRFSIPLLGMTSKPKSTLGSASDIVLELPPAVEACAATRAPTTSTTMQMALGDCLAVALLERRGFTAEDFSVFHPGGKLGAMLQKVADLAHVGDDLPLVSKDVALAEALIEMSDKSLGCVGLVDADGQLEGLITDGDVRRALLSDKPPLMALDVATVNPLTFAPDMLASKALQIMNDRKISQVFLVNAGEPVGIVHMHDFLRAGLR